MIKVLVVEDSAVIRELIVHILNSDPQLRVIGTAKNGEEALAAIERQRPDVITMDINMPKMDGFETTRRIMQTNPVPIVIVSANYHPDEVSSSFHAVEAGAVAVAEKPHGPGHPNHDEVAKKLIETVKLMSEVKVVRRWMRPRPAQAETATAAAAPPAEPKRPTEIKIVAMGASTGGPPVLQTILAGLPKDFSVPVLIAQHIAVGFLQGLVDWLGQTTGLAVHIATQGAQPQPGHVYFAPDDFHMGVDKAGRIALSKDPPESGLRPAVAYLFRSVTGVYGAKAAGVLLTGMGRDGAEELKLMKDKGAITIAQDKDSSVIHGMPGEAIKLDAATYILPPDRIATMLTTLAKKG
ncbi:MAG: chemotaxis-specific protein-glutamate methyltransferase CheB [Armatimonadota bacterium]|nr:chemotaxis-specific protein-glutamate methyltransferase CheB [Armatimonadota bacterium]